jgi:parvulin-like peptidyl-prolyl isomerase
MRANLRAWARAGAALAVLVTAASAAAQDLPVVKGRRAVASVQGDPITLDEFNRQRPAAAPADPAADVRLLNHLINLRLVAQEGRRMELDKLPEIRRMVDTYARLTLREELVGRAIKDVKADPKDVDEIYRNAVRQWTVSAVLFPGEAAANTMAAELAAGKDFAALAAAHLAAGTATKVDDAAVLKRDGADPAVAHALATLAVGMTSPVIRTPSGSVILKVQEIGYPEDAAARATAERIVVTNKRREAVAALDAALKKKYVKINEALLKSLDFESQTPDMEARLKDGRVLADIKGEKPITVAEMTEELKFRFFHGSQLAAERKRLNAKKGEVLDAMLHRRVFRKEALRLKLDRTDAYRDKVKEYEESVLFEAVLRKAVAPDVRVTEADVKAYYDAHRAEYATPEMIRIRSLAFGDQAAAEATRDLLRTGADFQWVASRVEGQLDPRTSGLLSFDSRPIMTSELPDGVRKAVAGAKSGDVMVYPAPEHRFYVLAIESVIAAQPEAYENLRDKLRERVVNAKIGQAVEEYAGRLRSLSDVKVYLKGA